MKTESEQPKYQRLKENIKGKIRDGRWQPGDKIFSERIMAERFGVSRITAKKAIGDLIGEGVLEHRKGKRGTFVKKGGIQKVNTKLIGVAIDDVRNLFGARMLRGIEDFLWEKRYHTIICNAERNITKVEQYFASLLENQIAGVIFAPVIDRGYVENNSRIIKLLESNKVAYVLIDRYVPGVLTNFVVSDHRESVKYITRHLLLKGHMRIVLAVGTECSSMDEGLNGYLEALAEAGMKRDEALIVRANDNLLYNPPDPAEIELMRRAVEKAGSFDAFLALNDRLLRAGISILLDRGLSIGQDVEIAAHGDAMEVYPRYTSDMPRVVEPAYEMGWEAAKILLEAIEAPGKSIVQVTLRSQFISQSSAAIE
jgi:DNA-binding LacI/PurR family transcriptional regulator